MYDYLLGAIESFFRYGMSPTALVVALVALFRTKYVRRLVGRRAPWLFKDEADVLNYQSRQKRIESKLDLLLEKEGIGWDAGKNLSLINTGKTSLTSSCKEKSSARTAGVFIQKVLTIILRGNRAMKKKLLSRKFLMAIISAALVIANDGLDLGLDQSTIVAFGSIVVGWIVSEAVVDVAKKPEVPSYDAKALDSIRQDSEGA